MDASEPSLLDGAPGAMVAVDDLGLIAHANDAALALLGWDRELIGLPLYCIIPERLRARHLTGFTRYLRSGESRLQGGTVRVPALLRSGDECMIDLTIRVYRRPDGSKLAVAALEAVALGTAPPALREIEDALSRRMYQLI
jgi:PAS domain S-box-containing protein